ncbi:conserved hypothetical protein [Talaromyces stipitatus ATCC 10500]|uniref:Zn(2)-C6 fungal-type domain-containing protein n=1 Tax=Talaromyces stipitatus (strain ATCC 10500 / CBS 375.48 / QM 6759 / NRRL 1006) TaxID=441959 RepID=B8M239_TALSN|nr:uncharacterized protein TSTA_087390 [Talaromyces stipitatus ATCC 10500]EED21503.1 conserved hypothetical protein [Talaromyces stipitatus ATCC 10500]
MTDTPGIFQPTTKSPSCTLCRKRKVKCDRKHPCSNCLKSNAECIVRESIPARHHKRRAEYALLSRLRHYENVLRRYGIDPGVIESEEVAGVDVDGGGGDGMQRGMSRLKVSEANVRSNTVNGPGPMQPLRGQFVARGGKTLYLEKSIYSDVWGTLGNELEDSDYIPDESDTESANPSPKPENESYPLDNGYDILFSVSSSDTLTSLHPNPVQIFKLWQIFLENVNPLTKIIHAPSLQQQMLNAIGDLGSMGKGMEALLFSIYSCALLSMTDEEMQKEFGQDKGLLQTRFRTATQKALANAGLLKTTDLVLLQAFCFYLVSCRSTYDQRTVWCLSGTAIRIAQQMGLHRDGSQLGLSVFETEMRRRVWWHIIYMDRSIARSFGFVSAPLPAYDTHFPLNVNDSELHPNMREPPVERDDVGTDMIFCQLRQELSKWHQGQPQFVESMFPGKTTVQTPLRTDEEVRDEKAQRRQKAVDDFRNIVQEKVVRFCDPSIPLHILVSGSAYTIISVIQLVVSRPFHLWVPDLKLPPLSQAENDELFVTCLDLIRHNEQLRNSEVLTRFRWHLDWHIPWPILLYIISELSKRSIVLEDTRQAWQCLDDLFLPYLGRLGPEARGPLHIVCLRLAAKAWNVNVLECRRLGIQTPPSPRMVEFLNKYSYSASKGRKGTPGREDLGLTVTTSQQEQQRQSEQLYDYSTTNPDFAQHDSLPANTDTDNAQFHFMGTENLAEIFGEGQGMLSNDTFIINWSDWDPFLQDIPPYGGSNF